MNPSEPSNARAGREGAAPDEPPADLSARYDRARARLRRAEQQLAQQEDVIDLLRRELADREAQLAVYRQSRAWRLVTAYQRARATASRAANVLAAGPRAASVHLLRRLLPLPAKRLLKRVWDPRRGLSTAEMDALEGVSARSAVARFAPPAARPRRASDGGADHPPVPLPTTYDVICFSIIDWEFRWQRPQQLMSQFAGAGHRVFFVSPSRFVLDGDAPYRIERLRDNVWEVRLPTPRSFDIYAGVLPADIRHRLVEGLRALRADENIACGVSVVQIATWAGVASAARSIFGWRLVYDCMDEWNTFPGIQRDLLQEEERLVGAADLLVVSAQRLWDKWSGRNSNTVLVRNATDFSHFHDPKPGVRVLDDVRGPIAGYFGAIAEWFDVALMERLARERPAVTFVLLGGVFGVDTAALSRLPNVRLLGQRPYAEMPAYLARFDVCLIPFKVNAVTEATDPVKFYEYISQGKPVVATRMPELYPYADDCYIADDADDFVRQVDLALAERDPAAAARRVALARENTWEVRLDATKAGIRAAHPRASVIVVTYNNLDYTRLCLDSVLRNSLHPNAEIVVVDNASTDGTPDYLTGLAAAHAQVRVLLNRENRGFAAANNQGIMAATGDNFVLLNNDTVTPNGWLPRLLRHLDRPQVGLVVAVTNFSGNESRIDVPYRELDGLEAFAADHARAHDGESFDIRVAAMYCVAMSRETFERVGRLDEAFGVGMFEDDDYSLRVRQAGLRVVCAEDSFVHHFGQSSFKKLSPAEYQAIWDRNQAHFEAKWGRAWEPHQPRA